MRSIDLNQSYFNFYILIFIIYSNLICCTGGYSLLKPLQGSAFAFFLFFTLIEVAIAFFLQHPALFAAHKLGVKLFFIQLFIFYINLSKQISSLKKNGDILKANRLVISLPSAADQPDCFAFCRNISYLHLSVGLRSQYPVPE